MQGIIVEKDSNGNAIMENGKFKVIGKWEDQGDGMKGYRIEWDLEGNCTYFDEWDFTFEEEN
jgi:hypothetical protein